jgi:hypothetical protein
MLGDNVQDFIPKKFGGCDKVKKKKCDKEKHGLRLITKQEISMIRS